MRFDTCLARSKHAVAVPVAVAVADMLFAGRGLPSPVPSLQRECGSWARGARSDARQRRSQAPSVPCPMPAASPSSLAPLPKGRELPACAWARCHPGRGMRAAARGTCMCPAARVKQTVRSRSRTPAHPACGPVTEPGCLSPRREGPSVFF